jgi:hypothetical protein
MNIDQVNAWNANAENIGFERIHYEPYWEEGKFQIPKHYIEVEDHDPDAPFDITDGTWV